MSYWNKWWEAIFYRWKAFLCIYCKQFPVTFAYAVTMHKYQRLSLDCAILDLSSNIFCAGMVYCHFPSAHLEGMYPKSVIVSNNCLEEVNRLHSFFGEDLPLYEISVGKKQSVKFQLLDDCDKEAPAKIWISRKAKTHSDVDPSPLLQQRNLMLQSRWWTTYYFIRTRLALFKIHFWWW